MGLYIRWNRFICILPCFPSAHFQFHLDVQMAGASKLVHFVSTDPSLGMISMIFKWKAKKCLLWGFSLPSKTYPTNKYSLSGRMPSFRGKLSTLTKYFMFSGDLSGPTCPWLKCPPCWSTLSHALHFLAPQTDSFQRSSCSGFCFQGIQAEIQYNNRGQAKGK